MRSLQKKTPQGLIDRLQREQSQSRNGYFAERRFGRILYTRIFLIDNATELQLLYKQIVPMELEYNVSYETFAVTALSHAFDPLDELEEIPFYKAHFKVHSRLGKRVTTLHLIREKE